MAASSSFGGAWRVLDFVGWSGTLDVHEHLLRLRPREAGASADPVAIADVAVVLLGPDVTVTAAVMHEFATHGVVSLWCDFRGKPYSAVHPWAVNTRVVTRQRAQAACPEHRKRAAWARIVESKIDAQARVLEHLGRPGAATLRRLARGRVRSGDMTNIEGRAAALYFPSLMERTDFVRSDATGFPVNAALNYGYGVFRARVIRAVLAAGLHPPLGLFHRGRANYFALADDLIEPFRPLVDLTVVKASAGIDGDEESGALPAALRHSCVEALSASFADDGKGVAAVMDHFAARLASYYEGETKTLEVPLWRGNLDA